MESGSSREVQQFLQIIYKISGARKVALDLVRSTEKAGSLAPPRPPPGHRKWRKACINVCKHILKFSNYVLVRVPINNNNCEQPIALFVIILVKNTFRNHHGCNLKLAPTRQQERGLEDAICICQSCIKLDVYLSTMVGQGEATYFIFSY